MIKPSYKQQLQDKLAEPIGANKVKKSSKPTTPSEQMIFKGHNQMEDHKTAQYSSTYNEFTPPQMQNNPMMHPNMNYPQQMYKQQFVRQPNMNHNMMGQPGMQHFAVPMNMQQMNMPHGMHGGLQQSIPQNMPTNMPNNLIHTMPQNMQHMHPGMMPNMQPGMQMNAQPHHNSPPIPTFTVDSYVGREKVNQVNVNDKYMGFGNKPPVQPNPPQHQKQVPVFTVDISSPGKLQEFMEERKFKVVERLAPSLTEKYQREDLEWSISEIKKSYEQKIKTLEEKQQEVCQEYFKEHHRVTLPQVKEIFKFVQRSIELNKEYSFDKNVELQQKSLEVINDIILNNYVVEDVAEEVEEQEAEHEPHNIPDYARYPQDQYYDPYSHKVDPHGNSYQDYSFDLRKDLDSFLKEIQLKKANMKEARQNVITKVQHLIDNIPHIEYAEIYGSYQTNLDLPWSDIDFVIFSRTIGGNECLDDLNMKFVEEKANNKWIKKIEYISTAYVPIIKIITEDSNFEVKVDITFKDETHRGSD